MPGDEDGKFTYIAHNDSSTIDYFIMSRSLVHMVSHLHVVSRIESKHMPVEMTFKLSNTFYDVANKPRKYQLQRYVWDQTKAQEYSATYSSEDISALFEHAVNLIDIDIEAAPQKFNEGIYRAGHCMQRTVVVGNDKNNPWFDHECRVKRRLLRQTWRNYNKACNTIETADLSKKYSEQRKKDNDTLKEKKSEHKKKLILKILEDSAMDSRKFWNTIKSATCKDASVQNTITTQEWFQHFYYVFNGDTVTGIDLDAIGDSSVNLESVSATLDEDITALEVQDAIRALKSNKAPGPDGLCEELYKYSDARIVNFLMIYFNKLFESGMFPLACSESVIQPLHKKGNKISPDNYRGISLLNVSGKLCSYVLNKRLTDWVEEHGLINEAQAVFRRNYSTIDHIFTLLAPVQKQLLNHGKLYVAFIDFQKAFDLVDRSCPQEEWRKRKNVQSYTKYV